MAGMRRVFIGGAENCCVVQSQSLGCSQERACGVSLCLLVDARQVPSTGYRVNHEAGEKSKNRWRIGFKSFH
jgi:hypothetical protein